MGDGEEEGDRMKSILHPQIRAWYRASRRLSSPCFFLKLPNLPPPFNSYHVLPWPWHPQRPWPNLAQIGSAAARP